MFVAEPRANFVRRIVLSDDGTTLRARSAYDKAEFLGSTDERFRPVAFSTAPDGTLMIVDFYRGVIQDRASTTVYLKNYIQKRNLDNPMSSCFVTQYCAEGTSALASRASWTPFLVSTAVKRRRPRLPSPPGVRWARKVTFAPGRNEARNMRVSTPDSTA